MQAMPNHKESWVPLGKDHIRSLKPTAIVYTCSGRWKEGKSQEHGMPKNEGNSNSNVPPGPITRRILDVEDSVYLGMQLYFSSYKVVNVPQG